MRSISLKESSRKSPDNHSFKIRNTFVWGVNLKKCIPFLEIEENAPYTLEKSLMALNMVFFLIEWDKVDNLDLFWMWKWGWIRNICFRCFTHLECITWQAWAMYRNFPYRTCTVELTLNTRNIDILVSMSWSDLNIFIVVLYFTKYFFFKYHEISRVCWNMTS